MKTDLYRYLGHKNDDLQIPGKPVAYYCGRPYGCRVAGRCRARWRQRRRRRTCTGPSGSCSDTTTRAPHSRGNGILCLLYPVEHTTV